MTPNWVSRQWRIGGWKASNTRWLPARSTHGKCISRISPRFSKAFRCETSPPTRCERWAIKRGAKLASETFVHELETMRNVFELCVEARPDFFQSGHAHQTAEGFQFKGGHPNARQFKQLVAQIRLSDGKEDNQRKSKEGADLVEFLAFSGARIGEGVGGASAWERRAI